MTTRPSANSRPSVVGIGTGTVSPARSRCRSSSVSHARSASLLVPSRPTATCPLTRTLHTWLMPTPPVSGSIRVTSAPHCPSASHPTGHIFAKSGHRSSGARLGCDANNPAAESHLSVQARPAQVADVPATGIADVNTTLVVADRHKPVAFAEPARAVHHQRALIQPRLQFFD